MAGMVLLGDTNTRLAGERAADAFAGAGLLTAALKPIVGARRPTDPHNKSGFPSGHASAAFAVATSLGDSYHSLRVPLYAWAAAVGWSRTEVGAHYWYQVIGGAALGFAVARWSRSCKRGLFHGVFVRPVGRQPQPPGEGLLGPTQGGFGLGWAWNW